VEKKIKLNKKLKRDQNLTKQKQVEIAQEQIKSKLLKNKQNRKRKNNRNNKKMTSQQNKRSNMIKAKTNMRITKINH
jgi:hypothetical protein